MEAGQELVLVVPRQRVPGGLDWRGVRPVDLEPYLACAREVGTFRPRAEVEQEPEWQQIIPYLALFDGQRIFLMRRTRAGGDARLHERYSIGIGGHINPGDEDALGALAREWREELVADFTPDFLPLGVLNDDSDPVGAVHLGLVFAADAGGRPVAVRETHKLDGRFATFGETAAAVPQMETWSGLLFDFLSRQRASAPT